MSEILDRSKSYLSIFTEDFVTDYTLPKFHKILVKIDNEVKENLKEREKLVKYVESIEPYYTSNSRIVKKYRASKDLMDSTLVDIEFFKNLEADDLTAILENEADHNRYKRSRVFEEMTVLPDDPDSIEPNIRLLSFGDDEKTKPKSEESQEKLGFFKRLFKKKKKNDEKKEEVIPEEKPEIDVLEFFSIIKLESTKQVEAYYSRIESYLKALKQAQDMGQTALKDKLIGMMFIAKYESLLKAGGFGTRIKEEQVVEFVKKTEKGVSLDYIKNYARPIPQEVIDKKLKADNLHVFDNYVVLHYDPQKKSYAQTSREKELERQKKADPILFGLINGSRNLYYIADWIDEYCDLTLDKFLKVTDSKDIKIEDKIRIFK